MVQKKKQNRKNIQQANRKLRRRHNALLVFAGIVFLLGAAVATAWHYRIPLATRAIARALTQQGVNNLSFTLAELSCSRIAINDIILETNTPALSIGRVEIEYTLRKLLHTQFSRVAVNDVRTSISIAQNGTISSPCVSQIQEIINKQFQSDDELDETELILTSKEFAVDAVSISGINLTIHNHDDSKKIRAFSNINALRSNEGQYYFNAEIAGAELLDIGLHGKVNVANGNCSGSFVIKSPDIAAMLDEAEQFVPQYRAQLPIKPDAGIPLELPGTMLIKNWKTLNLDLSFNIPDIATLNILPPQTENPLHIKNSVGWVKAGANLTIAENKKINGNGFALIFVPEAELINKDLRAGCSSMAIDTTVALKDSELSHAEAHIQCSDLYLQQSELHARGELTVELQGKSQLTEISGKIDGKFTELKTIPKLGLSVSNDNFIVSGMLNITNRDNYIAGDVDMNLHETSIKLNTPMGPLAAELIGKLAATIDGNVISANGELEAHNGRLPQENGDIADFSIGIDSIAVNVELPPFDFAATQNPPVNFGLTCENVGLKNQAAGVELRGLKWQTKGSWNSRDKIIFQNPASVKWDRFTIQEIPIRPVQLNFLPNTNSIDIAGEIVIKNAADTVAVRIVLPTDGQSLPELFFSVAEMDLQQSGALIATITEKFPGTKINGILNLNGHLTFSDGLPLIKCQIEMYDGTVEQKDLELSGIGLNLGIEQHGTQMRSTGKSMLTFEKGKAGNINFDKGRLYFQLWPEAFFLEKMELGWCKGRLNAYAVMLDYHNPKDNFTLYADKIDLGEALKMMTGVHGDIEGVLYGRLPIGIDHGKIKLNDGFLYSLPGRNGKLRLDDNKPILELLEKAGIKGDVQVPLSKALADMDISSVKMDLMDAAGNEKLLHISLKGKSNYAAWPAPVDLNLNLRGPIEEVLNLGLDFSGKAKPTIKKDN